MSVQPPPLIAESMRQYTCVSTSEPLISSAMVYTPFVFVPVEFLTSRHDLLVPTFRIVVVLAAAYVAVASCEMVMVVEPFPTIVTRPEVVLMVATAVLELL